jgi:hypothetical protein
MLTIRMLKQILELMFLGEILLIMPLKLQLFERLSESLKSQETSLNAEIVVNENDIVVYKNEARHMEKIVCDNDILIAGMLLASGRLFD